MGDGCKISFDENDDLVIEEIPDDLMRLLQRRAAENGRNVEDEMREILVELCRTEGPFP